MVIACLAMSALLAYFHYFGFALCVAGVLLRGRGFKQSKTTPSVEATSLTLLGDNLWGVGALLMPITGFIRASGLYEKPWEFYLHNHLFWTKVGLFAVIGVIETPIMIQLIRFRRARKADQPLALGALTFAKYYRINHIELGLLFLIPILAVMLHRGVGYVAPH